MGDYQGGGSYVASGCLDEDGYDNKFYMIDRGICNERF